MPTLPLFLNPAGRLCLVVGGGPVGLRKARAVLDAGAAVRLVCREPPPAQLPDRLTWLTQEYRPDHLDGVSLAFAAATPIVNRRVVADARARRVWVNSATEPEAGDFVLPAVARKGRVELVVGSGGASPAAAAHIRDLLAGQLDDAVAAWLDLLADLRDEVRARVPEARRATLLRRLADPEWLHLIRQEGPEAVGRAMRELVATEAGR